MILTAINLKTPTQQCWNRVIGTFSTLEKAVEAFDFVLHDHVTPRPASEDDKCFPVMVGNKMVGVLLVSDIDDICISRRRIEETQ